MARLTLRVRPAWWLMPYVHILAWLSAITDREPHWERVNRVLRRGLKMTIESETRDAQG